MEYSLTTPPAQIQIDQSFLREIPLWSASCIVRIRQDNQAPVGNRPPDRPADSEFGSTGPRPPPGRLVPPNPISPWARPSAPTSATASCTSSPAMTTCSSSPPWSWPPPGSGTWSRSSPPLPSHTRSPLPSSSSATPILPNTLSSPSSREHHLRRRPEHLLAGEQSRLDPPGHRLRVRPFPRLGLRRWPQASHD